MFLILRNLKILSKLFSREKQLKQNIMYTLTNEELEQFLIETDSFYDCPDEDSKQRMRDSYRKVEAESNQQITEAGGFTKWYESGRGRVLHF